MSAVGELVFPPEAMPKFIASVAQYTPNGRIIEPLKAYLLGEHGASGMLADLWGIIAVTLLLLFLCGLLSARKALA